MAKPVMRLVYNDLPKLRGRTRRKAGEIVRKTVFDLEAQAKQNIVAMNAVDTGAMLNSTQGAMTDEMSGRVAVGVDYGLYVHEGTRRMPGRPFLRMAGETVGGQFDKAMRGVFR